MEGFTIIDAVVAAIIVISAILAYSRGLVREAMSIVGWIAAAIAAFLLAPAAQPLMQAVPVLGDFLDESCELSVIAAFVAVFAVALIVASIFTPIFSGAIRNSALGGIDQGLGFLFGVVRGVLLVAVAMVVYERIAVTDPVAMVDESRTARIFARSQNSIDASIPEDAPGWIVGRYEQLVSTCDG